MAINLTSWNDFFLPPEVAESVMGVWGLPAELVLVPVPQGATQEHACGQIRCCSPDLLFLEGTLMGGVLYNDLCVTVLSSAGGWDPSRTAVAVHTQCELPRSSCHPQGTGNVLRDASASLPFGWSRHFSLPLALKERNTLCCLSFVPFWGSAVFRGALAAAGGLG